MAESPTYIQAQVAAALGIDITGDSRRVAAARLRDAVADAIGERYGSGPVTARQIEFARSLKLDLSDDTLRVASARIADELDRRNREALATLKLQRGDRVRIRKTYDVDGQHHEWVREFIVSTIDVTSRLHFKGGNGAGAWPTEVERVSDAASS
jgi:hypothetical protein